MIKRLHETQRARNGTTSELLKIAARIIRNFLCNPIRLCLGLQFQTERVSTEEAKTKAQRREDAVKEHGENQFGDGPTDWEYGNHPADVEWAENMRLE